MIYILDNTTAGRSEWNSALPTECKHVDIYGLFPERTGFLLCPKCHALIKLAPYVLDGVGYPSITEAAAHWSPGARIQRQTMTGVLVPLSSKEIGEAAKTILRRAYEKRRR